MKKSFYIFLASIVSCVFYSSAQGNLSNNDSTITIIEAIQTDSIIFIDQPYGLAKRISKTVKTVSNEQAAAEITGTSSSTNIPSPVTVPVKTAGYRVQVFSDNNARTAKSEARSKAQNISARLPQYRTYVVYQSPYWRLKVGDFTTLSEAENAAEEIKKLFPSYAREVRVVKDRINK